MSETVEARTCDVELAGCRPEPLASYLKALGVLRLVAEQKDKDASGFWRGEHFVLRSSLDRDALVLFFLGEWRPTPVVAPWNGASGFYPKDNHEAADAIVASKERRLNIFADSIEVGRAFIRARGWAERPTDEDKVLLLQAMRAQMPDDALAWLDAAVLIGGDRLLFPPLLGTGGNDGHLDFSNNFQRRVVEVITAGTKSSVESSLFGTIVTTRFKGAMGQYQPAAGERTNPWDFILLIEGALMFAGSATRRFESSSPATMAFPFHARAAGGISTVTDSDENESRDELWLPLWSAPTTIREVRRLFAEGRAKVGLGDQARPASTALDFARAVTALGVDRGIDSFTRVGFHVRNGLAYFATSLGRFTTGAVRPARLLDDIDRWFDRFRRKSSGKNVPAGVVVARRRLESAMFNTASTGALGPVLVELGEVERVLARTLRFVIDSGLHPVPRLPARWADELEDGTIEQRLGASLAMRPRMRSRLLPVDRSGGNFGRGDEPGYVFSERPLIENLHALLRREDVEAQQEIRGGVAQESGRARCSLTDIARFINGDVDDVLLERWMRAFVIVEGGLLPVCPTDARRPPALFAVLAIVHGRRLGDVTLPRTTGVLARACAGDSVGASEAAIRRLNASSRPFPVSSIVEPAGRTRRIAAALAFPLTSRQRRTLESMVLPPADDTTTGPVQELA
jgi:CRISPR-associated protein Csx17